MKKLLIAIASASFLFISCGDDEQSTDSAIDASVQDVMEQDSVEQDMESVDMEAVDAGVDAEVQDMEVSMDAEISD